MKELSKINLKLILTRIFAVIVFAIAIFGALNLSTVRAEELPADAPATEETTPEDEINIYLWYEEIFKAPDSFNKNTWVQSSLNAGQPFAGQWYRFYIGNLVETTVLFNVQYSQNGQLGFKSISYLPSTGELRFGSFCIEYNSFVIDDQYTCIEFYMPEKFDHKYCFEGYLDTVYHDYFDVTYNTTYVNPMGNRLFIISDPNPVVPEEPETPEEPGNGNVSDKVWDEFDGDGSETEREYGFIEKVGAVVSDILNIEDAHVVSVGWVTIVSFAVIVIAVFGLVFKK